MGRKDNLSLENFKEEGERIAEKSQYPSFDHIFVFVLGILVLGEYIDLREKTYSSWLNSVIGIWDCVMKTFTTEALKTSTSYLPDSLNELRVVEMYLILEKWFIVKLP